MGMCDSHCDGWYGPSANECNFWIENALRSDTGECLCETIWNGDDWSIYVGAKYAWSSRCHGGCFGPSANQCKNCIENSHMDILGYCIC